MRRLTGATALLAMALCLQGQQTAAVPTPPGTASPSAATDPAVIELSPFEVSAGSDHGFAARETLAGTLPDGSTYVAGYKNPYGATGSANLVNSLAESQVLGYLAKMEKNEFPLTGAPAEVLVPSRNAPIEGDVDSETELFFGYGRRLGKRVNWRVQLNIRNVFDDRDPMAQRANLAAGFVTVYAVPEPRSFILTNTFTF